MAGQKTAWIVYCSPSGATRHVAGVIRDTFRELGGECVEKDLGKRNGGDAPGPDLLRTAPPACLFIGSPVYVSHPVPPVMAFISGLPEGTGVPAVPFVTWGGACSGVALHDMGTALHEKGMTVVGAAKILALHSMMWRSPDPVGKGHPDAGDDRIIREMVRGVYEKLNTGAPAGIPLPDLAYYPENVRREMAKVTLKEAKPHLPAREVDPDLCTQCGICSEVCPVDAITFSPYPEFDESCIYCFNCVRECPEDAIRTDLSGAETRIRQRAEQFSERPLSRIFL